MEYQDFFLEYNKYIDEKILPILRSLNVPVEGNIITAHLDRENRLDTLIPKQQNFVYLLEYLGNLYTQDNVKNIEVLEIGFNTGYSSLLILMFLSKYYPSINVNLTSVDINFHKYVIPCYEIIKKDFPNLFLIPKDSTIALKELISENKKYDLIHIDGCHELSIAELDLQNSLKLSGINTIIIFDDTQAIHLNELCDKYVKNKEMDNFTFPNYVPCTRYRHRFFTVL